VQYPVGGGPATATFSAPDALPAVDKVRWAMPLRQVHSPRPDAAGRHNNGSHLAVDGKWG
jgi:hypothetical protein